MPSCAQVRLCGSNFQLVGKEYSGESETAVLRRINALLDYLEWTAQQQQLSQ
jgi:hypothetical protein